MTTKIITKDYSQFYHDTENKLKIIDDIITKLKEIEKKQEYIISLIHTLDTQICSRYS